MISSFSHRCMHPAKWSCKRNLLKSIGLSSNFIHRSLASYEQLTKNNEINSFRTLHEMQNISCKTFSANPLFGTFNPGSKRFEYQTYEEFEKQVARCRVLLQSMGVGEFDRVAMISNNRWEWAAIAMAAFSIRATIVPMYEAQLPADWTYILNDSGSTALFCANAQILEKVRKTVLPSTPLVQAVMSFDGTDNRHEDFAQALDEISEEEIENSNLNPPLEDDLADLIYTSGTTGHPKGVELTHSNFVSNVLGAGSMVDNPKDLLTATDRSLAFLPWAHSYGQTCELWVGLSQGASMGISRGIPSILEDLQLVQPTILFSVPTLYKRIHDGVHNMIETQSPFRANLLRKALHLGEMHAKANQGLQNALGPLESIQFSLLDRVVLSKIRDKFGGRLRYGCVAGAACPIEVIDFMDSLGIPICEGYGLTETSPIIAVNVPTKRRPGSVGQPISGVDVFIIGEDGLPVTPGEEGEICCTGPNVMKGYHNNIEATEEVISIGPDGISRMFHTGDLGRLDANGWLRVTGRIKEQYKLENGKYVVPTPIELAISSSRFISQVVLSGAGRPHNIALIVPDWEAIRTELDMTNIKSDEELATQDRVRRLIEGEITSSCAKFKRFEIPKQFAFVAPFTGENNMLTPKMSIRRHKVFEAYEDVIAHLYGDEPISTDMELENQREAA